MGFLKQAKADHLGTQAQEAWNNGDQYFAPILNLKFFTSGLSRKPARRNRNDGLHHRSWLETPHLGSHPGPQRQAPSLATIHQAINLTQDRRTAQCLVLLKPTATTKHAKPGATNKPKQTHHAGSAGNPSTTQPTTTTPANQTGYHSTT